MKDIAYSNFTDRIHSFLDQKHQLGYSYLSAYYILGLFAEFAVKHFPNECHLSKEIALSFCTRKDNEKDNTLFTRTTVIRQFAKYLLSIGEVAYIIPNGLVKTKPHPIPHIYSLSEIELFWTSLDSLKPKKVSVQYLMFPALFRVIYCCGLRPSEARKLLMKDVNLSERLIYINESKKCKSRIVTMSEDLSLFCQNYNEKMKAQLPNRVNFFPNSKGTEFCLQTLCKEFRNLWKSLNIPHGRSSNPPRIYDFRHSFATHRLYLWMKEKKDLNVMLPYLSAYMGHDSINETYYYIHLVPGLLEELSGKQFNDCERLLPEVSYE